MLIFAAVCVPTWFAIIYVWPRLLMTVYRRAILVRGFGDGPVPINTLYTEPQALFADPVNPPTSASRLATTGVNRDTLMAVGWLDLKQGPQVLHVPNMAGRYYSVQFTDPTKNTNFAYVGKRATGTDAGDFLVCGPRWNGAAPEGMARIDAPRNSVLVVGRVFVESERDLPTAHALATQIQFTPPAAREPSR